MDDSEDVSSAANTLNQLNGARKLVLGDPALYPRIVQGVIPIIGPTAHVELQRWGAEFLAEALSNPRVTLQDRQQMSLVVLPVLTNILDLPSSDEHTLKGTIQTAASIYAFVFEHVLNNPSDTAAWQNVMSIKSKIYHMWDTSAIGVRICCVKFVQNVVIVQTPGAAVDPRKSEDSEISLTMVPRHHPVLVPTTLEAEASGLLDRLLDTFHLPHSDALLIDATLNCLNNVLRTRPLSQNKILNAVLAFDPLKNANQQLAPKVRVLVKSMERTVKALLVNFNKKYPQHPLSGRIQQYVERLLNVRAEAYDDSNRKRVLSADSSVLSNSNKKSKLEDPSQSPIHHIAPLPPGPTSFAQLYTLSADAALTSFDVQQLPAEMVIQITLPVLFRIDQGVLTRAIEGIRSRYSDLQQSSRPTVASGVAGVDDDDDDDYEPDFHPTEDNEQILNKLDTDTDKSKSVLEVALPPFKIEQPRSLDHSEAKRLGEIAIEKLLYSSTATTQPSHSHKRTATGLNRLAAADFASESWRSVVMRIIARPNVARSSLSNTTNDQHLTSPNTTIIDDSIRNMLLSYIVDDFRSRMITAFDWLNEEWYNDRLRKDTDGGSLDNYQIWTLKLLNAIFPYVDGRDKNLLIRFLSELPEVSAGLLNRFIELARDPERVVTVIQALYYLVLFRPPAQGTALDALEHLSGEYDEARPMCMKMLKRYRPQSHS